METNSTTNAPATAQPAKSYYVPMEQYIAKAKVALTNAALPDVAPLLTKRGYPAAAIIGKLAELAALENLVAAQQKEYGEQYEATEAYHRAMDDLYTDYAEHLQLARMLLKTDTAAKTALGLKGERKKSNSGLTAQALLFYTGALANPAYVAALSSKGVEQAELQTAKDGWEHLNQLLAAQTKETGEAQQATADRDAAYDAFAEWMNEFYATAEIALRKTPQLMEKLGLVQG